MHANVVVVVGWEENSWGYHGDDGNSFHDGDPTRYGPLFTTGDVVGCGVDIAQGKAFFTKNGVYLGIAFDNIDTSRDLFPCFGLNTEGERITVNFGQAPFVFDIENHVQVSTIQWVKAATAADDDDALCMYIETKSRYPTTLTEAM